MASRTGAVWAIDIGNNSLKALQLSEVGNAVEVIGFDNIEHSKILTGTGVKPTERDELIALTLRRFVQQNDLGKQDAVVVSMPSQNSFARFVNLPPVEAKRIPEIVKFEASQQIPFDINEVQWDWQLMTESDSGESKVGIFAIKSDVVNSALRYFSGENIQVGYVQMAPMALYNYLLYDRPELGASDSHATVILNIGAENTDLVICTKSTAWQRAIPMGGNAFTKAIADAFKLNFEKAEKLKRTAAMSKYARQILQATKPVFTDLSSEIQRSLGFYRNSNPNTKLSKVIAFGGGTKMRGLLKYLQQSLQMPVERPDLFKRLAVGSGVSAAKFHENVCDFGVVYGLALQGLDLAKIESNLLPHGAARSMAWAQKSKYFTSAACILLLVSVLSLARTFLDKASYSDKQRTRQQISSIISAVNQSSSKLKAEEAKGPASEAIIQKGFELYKYRDIIPSLMQTMISTLPNGENNDEQQHLYTAFAAGDVRAILEIPRKQRKQIFVTNMSVRFVDDIDSAVLSSLSLTRGRRKVRRDTMTAHQKMMLERMMTGGGKIPLGGQRDIFGRQKGTDETKTGFVVHISGYSPYENIGELLDPARVEDQPDKWGVITRLLHLDDIVDGNSPFELYKRTDVKHFKLETGQVDFDAEMPQGIGLADTKVGKKSGREKESEQILIDPMTKEIISRVVELDENGREKLGRDGDVVYKVNDHWFTLDVKFVWKDAPKPQQQQQQQQPLPVR